jgi:hypothetical protein
MNDTLTTVLNFVASIFWPLVVLIIVLIFRMQISDFIARLKTVKWKDLVVDLWDTVPVISSKDNKIITAQLQPIEPPQEKQGIAPRLSDEEIEQSRQKALKRLQDDTAIVGYERGKLFQLANGGWAIAWTAIATIKVGVKAS